MRINLWVAGVLVLGWISPVLGDTLEKNNGQKFDGRVIAETADNVTFEVTSGGITFTQRVPRAQQLALLPEWDRRECGAR